MSPHLPRRIAACVLACIALAMNEGTLRAQAPTPTETIYWRQNLFLIPYQWSAQSAAAGQTVVLYVSRDRGASWQAVSEAKPQVRAFNYHAEGDGEYWFTIRTLDGRGNTLPAGPMQPELRVIVDTTIPRFEQLTGLQHADGTIEVRWRVTDANFDAKTSQIEVQVDRAGNWQPLTPSEATPITGNTWEATAVAPLSAGQASAVRVTAFDLARNRAVYQSPVAAAPAGMASPAGDFPSLVDGRGDVAAIAVAPSTSMGASDWVSPSAPPAAVVSAAPPAPPQPWPADRTADSLEAPAPAYAIAPVPRPLPPIDPPMINSEPVATATPADDAIPQPIADDRPLGDVPAAGRQRFMPLEPFRQASMTHAATAGDAILPLAGSPPINNDFLWLDANADILPVGETPKLVNSRTFALEYALEQTNHEGVARVELWGSRDGGKSWRIFAADDDNRSPLVVTVDGEGLYGFRMVVESAAGRGGFPPQPGEKPELWVGIDMHRPDVTLTAAEAAAGEDAGKLILRWDAADDNLDRRPIGLYYSSRATGPWTAIATNLLNSGEYVWRMERHVPPRVYLRIEARDTAGNVAAYQTSEPLAVEFADSVARISGVEAIPTSSN
jgi:hypothetical protein